ncbi:MAG: restriction endonuclease subunit S [Paludibacter sp.]|nr:restriction endonuclease subunit S [Paludibacter sp.]
MNDWPKVRLGEILTERRETPDSNDLDSGRVKIVEKISFGTGQLQLRSNGSTKTGMILVRPGDLLISGINAAKGAIAIYDESASADIAATIHYGAYIPNRGDVDVRFLWWMLRSRFFQELLFEYVPGGIKTELKAKRLLSIPVPLPPLSEQRRIVMRIEELTSHINEAGTLRQQAYEEATVLVASNVNAIFATPKLDRWPQRSLGDVAEIMSGVTLGRTLTGKTVRLPYLRVANVQDGHLDLSLIKNVEVLESEVEKWRLIYGDLLLTEGGDWDKLGRGTIWREEIAGCIHQNHIFRVRTRRDDFEPEFLAALIGSPIGKAYFQEASKQTTNLASINQRQLRAFRVVQPPLAVQRRIVAELDALQAEVDSFKRLQAKTATELAALLPAILDRAFKGEL